MCLTRWGCAKPLKHTWTTWRSCTLRWRTHRRRQQSPGPAGLETYCPMLDLHESKKNEIIYSRCFFHPIQFQKHPTCNSCCFCLLVVRFFTNLSYPVCFLAAMCPERRPEDMKRLLSIFSHVTRTDVSLNNLVLRAKLLDCKLWCWCINVVQQFNHSKCIPMCSPFLPVSHTHPPTSGPSKLRQSQLRSRPRTRLLVRAAHPNRYQSPVQARRIPRRHESRFRRLKTNWKL